MISLYQDPAFAYPYAVPSGLEIQGFVLKWNSDKEFSEALQVGVLSSRIEFKANIGN